MSAVRGRCIVCTCSFHSTNISALTCGHTFHYECISKWVKGTGKNCPICRKRCTERDLIKQLYFDAGVGDDTILEGDDSSEDGEALKAKVEDLAIKLRSSADEVAEAKSELANERKAKELFLAKLDAEKQRFTKRVPLLEARLRQSEMLLEDQEGLRAEARRLRKQLEVSEFSRELTRGPDYEAAIAKYVTERGDPDAGKFLVMLRKQLNVSRSSEARAAEAMRKSEERCRKLEDEKRELKKLVQALQEECVNLKSDARKEEPYNSKLKKVLEMSPPTRPSFGFNSSAEFDESLLNSAMRPRRVAHHIALAALETVTGSRENGRLVASTSTDLPSTSAAGNRSVITSSKVPSLNDTFTLSDDDSIFDRIVVPDAVKARVLGGSPRKAGGNGTGGMSRPAQRALERLEFGGVPSPLLAPRPVKMARRMILPAGNREDPKGTRLNTLSKWRVGKENVAEHDVVTLDDSF